MESSKWGTKRVEGIGKLERCLLGNKEIQIPEILVENSAIFSQVMSQSTWNETLTESQRQHLMKFLPKFPENDMSEKKECIRRLFAGDNFKFGNPLKKFQAQLKDGSYTPDIAKYSRMCRKVKQREYRYKQQKYYAELLKEILMSRQRVFNQLTRLPPDEPLKFDYVPPKPKENPVAERVKRKYKRLLEEVRQECGVEDTSSEDEEPSPIQRSKKQLYKSLGPIPSPEPTIPSVQATFAIRPPCLTNGEDGQKQSSTLSCDSSYSDSESNELKRPRPISPIEISEDDYRKMLLKHHQRMQLYDDDDDDDDDHPEYNTQNITLQDVMARCQAAKKGEISLDDDFESTQPGPSLKKKLKKEKGDKKLKKKPTAKKISEMDIDVSNVDDDDDFDMKTTSSMTRDDDIGSEDFVNVETLKEKEEFKQYASFFSLLRDFICCNPDQRISSPKLEEKVRLWQESAACDLSPWVIQLDNWVDAVYSALKFLAGEAISMNIENFIPYLDYKERAQQWRWIGNGRDSDDVLATLCHSWLTHKDEVDELVVDMNQGTPPPARSRTTFVVRLTTEEEKADFREQEKVRFDNPHRAFTYVLHNYESVVAPVKGIFNRESSVPKAREHALLVSSRPSYVTILTLVRDSAARLPNGEGTRGDICELLKDSQFLAPGVTDAQLNVVVSGALDRLHSEKDPCVKYDVNRKIWIYLHRSRTEEEFEKIHQAQAAAAKARKSLHKVKVQKTPKPKEQPAPVVSNLSLPSSLSASSESINVEDVSPQQQQATQAQLLASPKTVPRGPLAGHGSPKTGQVGVGPRIAEGTKTSLRQVINSMVSAQANKPAPVSPQTGTPQTLSVSQLQFIQQAAHAQAQHSLAAKAEAAKVLAQATAQGTGAKTVAQVLGETASKAEVISMEKAIGQGQLKITTPQSAPPNIIIRKPDLLRRQVSGTASQVQGTPSPQVVTTVSMLTKTVTTATISQGGSTVTVASSAQPGANPLMARLVQQMGTGQVLSVSDLLAAQRLQQQQGQQQQQQAKASPAFKIQGANVVQQVPGGAKPVTLTGKPLTQAKGQLVQIGGKGQQQLGLIQTPKGTINIIPQQTGTSGGIVTIPQSKTAGSTDAIKIGAPLPTAAGQSRPAIHGTGSKTVQVINQSKPGTQNPVVVTHMTPGGLALRPGGRFKAGGSSILVTTSAGPAQNLQMVRTVLSQPPGLKPGQAILISQPALQTAGTVIPQAQVLQGARPAGKQTQMYAKIITPPSGVKFSTVGTGITMPTQGMIHTVGPTGQTVTVQSEGMLQTFSKLLSASNTSTPAVVSMTTGVTPATSIATGQHTVAGSNPSVDSPGETRQ